MQKEKEKKIFSNSHQQVVFSHLLESKASIHEAVAPKDRCFHNYLPLFSFYSPLHPAFNAYMTSYGVAYPFGWFRSASPHLLPIPSLLALGKGGSGNSLNGG